jgi:putative ABC transport system permease protein
MYILENAFRNVLRNRGRNILIGAIIFAVIVTTVIALMINNTTSGIINDYKSRFGAEVRLEPNMQKVRDEAMANSTNGLVKMIMPSIPPEQYIAFGESEYLQGSIFTASAGVTSDNIQSIDAELGGGSGMMMMGGGPGDASANTPMEYMMSLQGNSLSEFDTGTRELASGEMPDELNECIVSADLAELNDIQIGDNFSFTGEIRNMEEGIFLPTSYTLTVVGTYYDVTDEYTEGGMQNAFTNRRNEILTTYDTVAQEIQPDLSGIKIGATYFLKEPGMLDAFAEEVYSKGLAETFDVTTDEAAYNKIVGPVEGLRGISVTFMIVVLVFGGSIIALLSSIAIRERKYEIGVLRAMGMKIRKVALGLWVEMLIITFVCLAVGLGFGKLAAQPIANTMLAGQIEAVEASEEEQSSGAMMMMPPQSSSSSADAEPLSNIDISMGLETTLQIMGIALLLATLAGLVSISRITKYEPIKILMERN